MVDGVTLTFEITGGVVSGRTTTATAALLVLPAWSAQETCTV